MLTLRSVVLFLIAFGSIVRAEDGIFDTKISLNAWHLSASELLIEINRHIAASSTAPLIAWYVDPRLDRQLPAPSLTFKDIPIKDVLASWCAKTSTQYTIDAKEQAVWIWQPADPVRIKALKEQLCAPEAIRRREAMGSLLALMEPAALKTLVLTDAPEDSRTNLLSCLAFGLAGADALSRDRGIARDALLLGRLPHLVQPFAMPGTHVADRIAPWVWLRLMCRDEAFRQKLQNLIPSDPTLYKDPIPVTLAAISFHPSIASIMDAHAKAWGEVTLDPKDAGNWMARIHIDQMKRVARWAPGNEMSEFAKWIPFDLAINSILKNLQSAEDPAKISDPKIKSASSAAIAGKIQTVHSWFRSNGHCSDPSAAAAIASFVSNAPSHLTKFRATLVDVLFQMPSSVYGLHLPLLLTHPDLLELRPRMLMASRLVRDEALIAPLLEIILKDPSPSNQEQASLVLATQRSEAALRTIVGYLNNPQYASSLPSLATVIGLSRESNSTHELITLSSKITDTSFRLRLLQLMALSREPQAIDHLISIAKNPAHSDFLGAIQCLAQTGESRGAEIAASVLTNPQISDDLKAELIRSLQPNDQGAAVNMTPILLAMLDSGPSGTLGSSAAESLWICLRLAPYGSSLRKTMIDRSVAIASDSKQSGNTRKTILNLLQDAPPSEEIVQMLKTAIAKERNATLRKFMENALSWQEKAPSIWN